MTDRVSIYSGPKPWHEMTEEDKAEAIRKAKEKEIIANK